MKHTWILNGKGYFSNESLMLKYGSMKFYGTEKELDIYLEENPPERIMPSGKVLSYNSWEHALLGHMMAEVTGQPFDTAMRQFLFEPLGMENSTFTQPLPASIEENLATGYAFDGDFP